MKFNTDTRKGIVLRCALCLLAMMLVIPDFLNYDIAYKNKQIETCVTQEEISSDVSAIRHTLPIIYIRSYDIRTLYAMDYVPKDNTEYEPVKYPTTADIYVIDREENYITDAPTHVYKNVTLTMRGNSSSLHQSKKSFNVEFSNEDGTSLNMPFMGMKPESDFVLFAPQIDRSLIRNYLGYTFQRLVLDWGPECYFAEVYVDERGTPLGYGDYKGVYMVTEKVKKGVNRLNTGNFVIADNPERQFEEGGGYVYKMDWYNPRLDGCIRLPANSTGNEYSLVSLKKDVADQQQIDTVFNEIQMYDEALYNGTDEELAKYFDLHQIARCILINEYLRNHEGISSSTFFYRTVGGKLKIFQWDFDLGTGNIDYRVDFSKTREWWILGYWPYPQEFLQHENFRKVLKEEWEWLRSGILSDENVMAAIAQREEQLDGAWQRNDKLYRSIFTPQGKPFSNKKNPFQNSQQEREYMKEYLLIRGQWMDENLDELLAGY